MEKEKEGGGILYVEEKWDGGEGEVVKEWKSEGDGKWRERGGMITGWKKRDRRKNTEV